MGVRVSGSRASQDVRYGEIAREAHEPSLRREVSGCDAMGIQRKLRRIALLARGIDGYGDREDM
jgi:hypothetical protein